MVTEVDAPNRSLGRKTACAQVGAAIFELEEPLGTHVSDTMGAINC
jgi:hypothetical protein